MDIDLPSMVTGTLSVLAVGLLLGAGLPLLFSFGIVLQDKGSGGEHRDGSVTAPNVAAKYAARLIFVVIALVVVYGLLFITKSSISHYLGIELPL
jgi:hypothetical protein